MYWCFGLVNKRLAEIFFEKKGKAFKIFSHVLVKESEYAMKKEKEWIKKDVQKVRFSYKNGAYRST